MSVSPSQDVIYFNRLHFPVTTLGYGRRLGLWVQGCSIHCPGCIAPDTWHRKAEHALPIKLLLRAVERWLTDTDGVTISGGEPFDQPQALSRLLSELRQRCAGDLLVYSGYSFAHLRQNFAPILDQLDLVVSGPYVERLTDQRAYVGSSNQEIHLLTKLAQERYQEIPTGRIGFGVSLQDNTLYLAGVPGRGTIPAVLAELAKENILGKLANE